jgi:uncharacterized protein YydD (DUF2326 family)
MVKSGLLRKAAAGNFVCLSTLIGSGCSSTGDHFLVRMGLTTKEEVMQNYRLFHQDLVKERREYLQNQAKQVSDNSSTDSSKASENSSERGWMPYFQRHGFYRSIEGYFWPIVLGVINLEFIRRR